MKGGQGTAKNQVRSDAVCGLCRKTPFLSRRRQQVRCRRSRMMKVQAMLVMIATSFTERGLGEVDPWLADRRPRLDLQRKPRTT